MPEHQQKHPQGAKSKEKPKDLVIPPKKPKLSKAERRAQQEQQRAAKAAREVGQQQGRGRGDKGGATAKGGAANSPAKQQPTPGGASTKVSTSSTANVTATVTATTPTRSSTTIVSHLSPYRAPNTLFSTGATLQTTTAAADQLHPAVIETGYRYATGQIRGGNARCRAMLQCFATLLQDFCPDAAEDARHAMDHQVLKPAFQYWTEHCRPHSVSMGNAFSFLKTAVASLDRDLPYEPQAKEILLETMVMYEKERIDYADTAIAELACKKLLREEGEVLMVYGYSEVISKILEKAIRSQKKFRVIVVDSRPAFEGRKLLEQLSEAGVECTYVLLNALTYVLQDVTKVLLGASALMSDGSVYGRVGSASVALAANANNIPVLICSETYKISNRVQLESITTNELGDPRALATGSLEGWKETEDFKILNLLYDLTPAAFVSGIVTELGIVPPTSVAVLLREMNPQDFKST